MLLEESLWLKKAIQNSKLEEGYKVLNFGSQDERVYKYQPYLYSNIIKPSISKGVEIINYDLFPGKGVDISGNLLENKIFEKLKSYKFDAIYLFNVLEHVENIERISNRIEDLLIIDGLLFISVPYSFPVHFDPIDNLFRPTPEEVANLFKNCIVIESSIIEDHHYIYYLFRNWRIAFKFILRILTPFYKYNSWKRNIIPKIVWFTKTFKVTCLILRKKY